MKPEIITLANKVLHDLNFDKQRTTTQIIAEAISNYAEQQVNLLNKPAVINCAAAPEWLTEDMRAKAKQTWNEHKVVNDNKRVEAMRIVQRGASAAGYTIDIKKAVELLKQHCL